MNFIEIVDKVRNNEALSREELDLLLAWLLSDEGKHQFEEEIKKRWAVFETTQVMEYGKILRKIHQRIDALPSAQIKPQRKWMRYLLDSAAVLLLAFVLSFFIKKETGLLPDNRKIYDEQVEVYNPKGLRTTIILPDSSKVILNADSKISYAHRFVGANRAVKLEGEAYFEVVKDSLRPFIVEANTAKVIVHGTSFNVRSYPSDQFIETTLLEGSLTVDAGKEKNLLVPGKQVSINKASMESDVHAVNTQRTTGWIEGKIYFHSNTFLEIATILERTFNVNIKVGNQSLYSKKFTGKFENGENLEQILHVLKLSVSFNDVYDKETNTIIIS